MARSKIKLVCETKMNPRMRQGPCSGNVHVYASRTLDPSEKPIIKQEAFVRCVRHAPDLGWFRMVPFDDSQQTLIAFALQTVRT